VWLWTLQSFECDYDHNDGCPQGGGQNGHMPSPLKIEIKDQNFLEILKSAAYFLNNWFNFCYDSLFAGITLTLHRRQVHCSGVMQLRTLFCLQRQVRKLRTGCSTVGLYCLTIAWQQIFKGSLRVTVAGVLLACVCWTQTSCQAMQRDSDGW